MSALNRQKHATKRLRGGSDRHACCLPHNNHDIAIILLESRPRLTWFNSNDDWIIALTLNRLSWRCIIVHVCHIKPNVRFVRASLFCRVRLVWGEDGVTVGASVRVPEQWTGVGLGYFENKGGMMLGLGLGYSEDRAGSRLRGRLEVKPQQVSSTSSSGIKSFLCSPLPAILNQSVPGSGALSGTTTGGTKSNLCSGAERWSQETSSTLSYDNQVQLQTAIVSQHANEAVLSSSRATLSRSPSEELLIILLCDPTWSDNVLDFRSHRLRCTCVHRGSKFTDVTTKIPVLFFSFPEFLMK